MMQILLGKICKICDHPRLKNVEQIAYLLVSRYPDSFRDETVDAELWPGLESLTSQLLYRCDNVK